MEKKVQNMGAHSTLKSGKIIESTTIHIFIFNICEKRKRNKVALGTDYWDQNHLGIFLPGSFVLQLPICSSNFIWTHMKKLKISLHNSLYIFSWCLPFIAGETSTKQPDILVALWVPLIHAFHVWFTTCPIK